MVWMSSLLIRGRSLPRLLIQCPLHDQNLPTNENSNRIQIWSPWRSIVSNGPHQFPNGHNVGTLSIQAIQRGQFMEYDLMITDYRRRRVNGWVITEYRDSKEKRRLRNFARSELRLLRFLVTLVFLCHFMVTWNSLKFSLKVCIEKLFHQDQENNFPQRQRDVFRTSKRLAMP